LTFILKFKQVFYKYFQNKINKMKKENMKKENKNKENKKENKKENNKNENNKEKSKFISKTLKAPKKQVLLDL
jgi:RNA:NAD 2'-phosphotransferase (TPT1/KptA family)